MPRARSMAPRRRAEELVTTRPGTHGNFSEVAGSVIGFNEVATKTPNWNTLGSVRQMSLTEIFHKVARILCGDPEHVDHWDDIGGYAELGKKNGTSVDAPSLMRAIAKGSLRRPRRAAKKVQVRPAKKAAKKSPPVPRRAKKAKQANVRKRAAKAAVRPARVRRAAPAAPVAAVEAA